MRKQNHGSRLIAGALALAIVLPAGGFAGVAFAQQAPAQSQQPNPQVPQPSEGGVNWPGVGYGAGALASNVVYIPAKLAYALVGGLVGGAAYGVTLGNGQTADTIWRSSLGGDYVVTPDMLQGKEQLHFNGPTATPPAVANRVQPLVPQTSSNSGTADSLASSPAIVEKPIDNGTGPRPGSAPSGTLPSTSIE